MIDTMRRSGAPDRRTVRVDAVMGTVVSLDLRSAGDHEAAVEEAFAWFAAVDARFSTYRADSEVSRFGRGEIGAGQMSQDLAEVSAACEAVRARSSGAFDPRLPGGWDPSAFVKGWSVDRAGAILAAHGCDTWSVNAGGDVRVASGSGATAPWRIGVQHPFDPAALAAVLQARDLAVATSGRYERGDHVLDPRTGRAATEVASVTVVGPELGLADACSTAALVLGADGPAWVAGIDGYECSTILSDGRVLSTAGFPRSVCGVPVSRSPYRDLVEVRA